MLWLGCSWTDISNQTQANLHEGIHGTELLLGLSGSSLKKRASKYYPSFEVLSDGALAPAGSLDRPCDDYQPDYQPDDQPDDPPDDQPGQEHGVGGVLASGRQGPRAQPAPPRKRNFGPRSITNHTRRSRAPILLNFGSQPRATCRSPRTKIENHL